MFKYPIFIVEKKDSNGIKNSVGGGGTYVPWIAQGHHVL